jgi:hypothetical protein
MTVATDYLHVLEGRIRIKIPELKGAPEKAQEIKGHLSATAGVHSVQANPITGNALILYDSRDISPNDLIIILKEELGCFKPAAVPIAAPQAPGLAGTVARAFMESALQTVVMALI